MWHFNHVLKGGSTLRGKWVLARFPAMNSSRLSSTVGTMCIGHLHTVHISVLETLNPIGTMHEMCIRHMHSSCLQLHSIGTMHTKQTTAQLCAWMSQNYRNYTHQTSAQLSAWNSQHYRNHTWQTFAQLCPRNSHIIIGTIRIGLLHGLVLETLNIIGTLCTGFTPSQLSAWNSQNYIIRLFPYIW